MPRFESANTVDRSGSIPKLAAKRREWTFKPLVVTITPDGVYPCEQLSMRTIRDILLQHCGWNDDVYQQFRDLLAIQREPSKSLRDILDNHATVSRMNPLPLGTTPCACHEGPFKSYYDESVGHVLTHSSTILEPLHPLLAEYGVGFNYRFYPDPSSDAIHTAIRNFWSDIGGAADEFIRVHHPEAIFDRNRETIMSNLNAVTHRWITKACMRERKMMIREHIPCPTGNLPYVCPTHAQVTHGHLS